MYGSISPFTIHPGHTPGNLSFFCVFWWSIPTPWYIKKRQFQPLDSSSATHWSTYIGETTWHLKNTEESLLKMGSFTFLCCIKQINSPSNRYQLWYNLLSLFFFNQSATNSIDFPSKYSFYLMWSAAIVSIKLPFANFFFFAQMILDLSPRAWLVLRIAWDGYRWNWTIHYW